MLADERYEIERRYSILHDGWFWSVWYVPEALYVSGYARRHRSMERAIRRCVKSHDRRLARADREMAKAA